MRDVELGMLDCRFPIDDFQSAIANRKLKIERGSMSSLARMVVLLSVVLVGVTCAGEIETIKGTLTGTIYVIGNEPFTSLALQDSTGKMYRISTMKDVRDRLLARQGRLVVLEYSKADTTREGITLSVKKFTEITP